VSPKHSFKYFNSRNYSLKKSIVSIFNVLNTIIFIKIYYLKVLKSAAQMHVNNCLIRRLNI